MVRSIRSRRRESIGSKYRVIMEEKNKLTEK